MAVAAGLEEAAVAVAEAVSAAAAVDAVEVSEGAEAAAAAAVAAEDSVSRTLALPRASSPLAITAGPSRTI